MRVRARVQARRSSSERYFVIKIGFRRFAGRHALPDGEVMTEIEIEELKD